MRVIFLYICHYFVTVAYAISLYTAIYEYMKIGNNS